MAAVGDPARVGAALLERLAAAVNSHDLDALVGCFAPGYRNETPAHPAQGFTARGQVQRNWEQIFTFMPDIAAPTRPGHSTWAPAWTSSAVISGTGPASAGHRAARVR